MQHQVEISVARTHSSASKTPAVRFFHLWHLLSLDAPTVAALWTFFIARTVHIGLSLSSLLGMFLAVWMLYAADRLLDARQLESDPLIPNDLEARHLFHHRYAAAFVTGIVLASLLLAALLHSLQPEALRLYAILGSLLFAWFLLIHLPITPGHHRLPKELAVGILFPAAVFIPTIARRPDLRLSLLPCAALFAAVCTLNCLAIYAWEHPGPLANAHWTTRYGIRHLTALFIATSCAALSFTALSFSAHPALWPLSLAASLSALTLLALHLNHRRVSPLSLRASADLALLTPLLMLAWSLR